MKVKNPNMKVMLRLFIALFIGLNCASAQEMHVFTSPTDGKKIKDKIIQYDIRDESVMLERRGSFPLSDFSKEDQAYILNWNQTQGFSSQMHFKIQMDKYNWERMKTERNITPYLLEPIQIPGKATPHHELEYLDDYEEYASLELEAEGFGIILRNQNLFPIKNITVESKIFYEQEVFVVPDDILRSMERDYRETVTTNKVKFISEQISSMVPHEEVTLYTASSIIVDQKLERTSLVSDSEDDEDDEVIDSGEWDNHVRKRSGKLLGAWIRVGIKNHDGIMIWRELTEPSSLPKKVNWDGTPIE